MVKHEWGGTETVIVEISKHQLQRGFRPEIYTSLALAETKAEEICGILTHRFGYTYTRLGLSGENKQRLDKRGGDLYSLSLFLRLLFCPRPTVFHIHTLGRIGAMTRLVSRMRGVPYIVSIHGGAVDLPSELIEEIIRPLKGTFNWGKPLDIILRKNRVLDDADGIVCLGIGEMDGITRKYPNKKTIQLPNGVDPEKFSIGSKERFREKYNIPSSSRIILSVASFYSQKNQLLLIESFAKLRHEGHDVTLVLVGVVYDYAYLQDIIDAVTGHELNDAVFIIKNLDFDGPELSDCYAACDIFVHPSKYEAFGIVILEAWAAGKPVICAAVGGIKSFVFDGENGLFFDLDSSADLFDKIRLVMYDDTLRDKLTKGGIDSVRSYQWDNITDQLLAFYQTVQK